MRTSLARTDRLAARDRAAHAGTSHLQRVASGSSAVRALAALQAKADGAAGVAQLSPIGTGHGYRAVKSAATFLADHLANDKDGARAATLGRGEGRGMENTVLLHSETEVKNLVLAADWNACTQIGGPVYRVPIMCNYVQMWAAHGVNGAVMRREGEPTSGTVWVKVFFDEAKKTVSVTGVESVG